MLRRGHAGSPPSCSGVLDSGSDQNDCRGNANHIPMIPDCVVIIPHYNDTVRLRRCLSVLVSRNVGAADIVVVDNASSDPMEALVADFPQVRFVTETRKGAANARNRGVAETTGHHLFFLDADCVPDAGWLASAVQNRNLDDIVGGAITVFDETPPPRSGAQAFETVFAFNYRDYILNKGFSVTANLLTRRDVFLATGPFTDGVSEDEDWCRRARALGFGIALAEGLRVAHPTRSDWPSLRRKWRRLTDEMFRLHLTRKGRISWALRALAVAGSGPAHLPKVLRHPGLRGADERLRCAATLVRLRLLRSVWMLRQAAGLPIR
jgi:GT2 family glycosyltransferase